MWRERAAAGYESKVCLILPGCVYRRDRRQHEHGETERASPAWRPGDWRRADSGHLRIAATTSSSVKSDCLEIRANSQSACSSNGEMLPPVGLAATREEGH